VTDAERHAQAATVTVDEWIRRVRLNDAYKWEQTEWGKALLALERDKPRAGGPPRSNPQPPSLTLQRTIFWANVTDDAVAHASWLGASWRHALTADPAYAPSADQIAILKRTSAGVDAWGNQVQISYGTIGDFRARWNLSRVIHQGETEDEYDAALSKWVIGNPNSWSPAQRTNATRRIAAGELAITAEVYDGRPDTYSAQGVPVSSLTLGVALDGGVRYPLADLLAKTPVGARSSVCIWHGAGLQPEDWEMLMKL
jgi:hypothetical protein